MATLPTRARAGEPAELLLAALFVALALLLRAPALLYSVINFDESLYLLFGDDLARGVLPYTHICDRKPFGLFAVFALFAMAPLDAVVASRLGASLSVGLTAYLLHRVAGRLFDDRDRLIGPAAGLAYVVFSLADGGMASNAEVFVNAFAVLGLLLTLQAAQDPRGLRRPRLLAAGLVLGLGIQVKQTILFDLLAFLAGFYLLTTPRLADLGARVRATWPSLAALGAASLTPTLAVVLLYAATGHWNEWATANIGAQRGFVDDPGQPIAWAAAFQAAVEQAPLWAGTVLAALLWRRLTRDRDEARSVAFLLVWVAAIFVLQLFLRIAADHYFLQFLPSFCLLNGFLLGRGLLAAAPRPAARVGLLAAVAALTLFGTSKNQLVHNLHVLHDRVARGKAWAGDTPRRIAADLRPALRPGEAIYQVGFLPIVYHLTGAAIPTRFAFTGLPHRRYPGRDGCAWVPREIELRRVLDARPRFVVVEDGVFYAQLDPAVKAMLDRRLARDYRLWRRYDMHPIHKLHPFERFVLNAAAGAWVYELADGTGPGPAPTASALPDQERGDDVVPDHPDRDPGQRRR
jgi:4-amino-4-deoxy-L-arabinose transferase-like glycosyltransferase